MKIMTKKTSRKLRNIHPGEVLREEFLVPLGISQYRLAKEIGVTEARISAIGSGKRAITAARPCGWRLSSARAAVSGWGCRRITIPRKRQRSLAISWRRYTASSRWLHECQRRREFLKEHDVTP
ncbi:HigA family addiction module antitoxin [Candidatus Ferrigenium straubiae]|jgi:addiction module HigA family antidote|uniref:HigA family addiction module antitoxin n=1 Tax=Candidatus Ferrigenium straubiae TaxID=2919506 RepID=UPI003F4AAC88